jgi:hypothetical protein
VDLNALHRWLSTDRRAAGSVEQLLADIAWAIEDYTGIFPAPYALAPNLQLASEASAVVTALIEERNGAMDSQGLPRTASLDELIGHHRGNAALAGAMQGLNLGGDEEIGLKDQLALSDKEWRAFQNIPEQGYSHRAWVEARIRERVALAIRDRAVN